MPKAGSSSLARLLLPGPTYSNHSHHPWKLQADATFSSLALPPGPVNLSVSQEEQLVVPLSGSQPRP